MDAEKKIKKGTTVWYLEFHKLFQKSEACS